MFYDIGRKLQKLALVIFWVIVAMSVIYPVVIVILAGGGGGLIFLTIIVCGAIGVPLAWGIASLLYAFGELVTDCAITKKQVGDIIDRLDKMQADNLNKTYSYTNHNAAARPQESSDSENKVLSESDNLSQSTIVNVAHQTVKRDEPLNPITNVYDIWYCKNCGQKNKKSIRICIGCGMDK